MRELINLLAKHARECFLQSQQIDLELQEIAKMKQARIVQMNALLNQLRAAKTMLQYLRDGMPPGLLGQDITAVLENIERPEDPHADAEPPWDQEDEVALPDEPPDGEAPPARFQDWTD